GRGLRARDAGGARQPDRAGRHQRLGRPAPAPGDRARAPARARGVPVRRFLLRARPGDRGARARRAGAAPRARRDDPGRADHRERALILVVLALAITSVTLAVSGPKVLGEGTDIIFRGYLSSHAPSGANQDMMRSAGVEPGRGIDLDALADVLVLALVLYAGASLFAWLQGH